MDWRGHERINGWPRAGQPIWLVVLFFIPFSTAVFTPRLGLLPSPEGKPKQKVPGRQVPGVPSLDEFIPRSQSWKCLLSILLTSRSACFFAGGTTLGGLMLELLQARPARLLSGIYSPGRSAQLSWPREVRTVHGV